MGTSQAVGWKEYVGDGRNGAQTKTLYVVSCWCDRKHPRESKTPFDIVICKVVAFLTTWMVYIKAGYNDGFLLYQFSPTMYISIRY